MNVVILPPAYLPDAEWFADLAAADLAVLDANMRYDKRRKNTHRTLLGDTREPLRITVPVSMTTLPPEAPHRTWADVTVSAHGHWWTVHTGAIESVYGNTPYFEHYWPLLKPLFAEEAVGEVLTLFTSRVHSTLRLLLGIPTPVSATMPRLPQDAHVTDLRRKDYTGPCILGPLFQHGPRAMQQIIAATGPRENVDGAS